MNFIYVALGSMFGGVSRYLIGNFIQNHAGTLFAIGTFMVNIIGCFIIGIITGYLVHTNILNENHRLFLVVGFCGSFTTFSTFSLDNLNYMTSKAFLLFSLNIGLSVLFGLAATWLGIYIIQSLYK